MSYDAFAEHAARYRVESTTALANRYWATHHQRPRRRRRFGPMRLPRLSLVPRRLVVHGPRPMA